MKKVTFIRHAKSSWGDASVPDIKRPLNSRGKHDAPLMGKVLRKKLKEPDLLISSPAKRAFRTAAKIAAAFDLEKEEIKKDRRLYMAEIDDFLEVIRELSSSYSHIFIFTHNPGVTDIVNFLTGTEIYNIPTCGTAHIELDISDWKDIGSSKGALVFYDFPKNHY